MKFFLSWRFSGRPEEGDNENAVRIVAVTAKF
jgi:hypothetical protein